MTGDVWLTISEASELTGIPVRTLRRWCAEWRLAWHHFVVNGRMTRKVKKSDLDNIQRPKMGGNR